MLRNLSTLDSFKNSAFRFYFFGMIGQWASYSMLMIVQSLLVYRLTGSSVIIGVLALGTAIPQLLFFMIGGSLADRFSKKRLIQIGQAMAGLMALLPGIAISTGYMTSEHPESWWILLVAAIIQGIFNSIVNPARQAIIPELVKQDKLMNALALNTMGQNVFRLLAPAAAGFVIDYAGFAAVFYLMAGLYFGSIFLTAFIPETFKPVAHTRSTLAEAGEGMRYISKNRPVYLILSYAIFFIILFMPYQAMMPVFTETILNVGATELGLLQSFMGIGALAASLVMASVPNRHRGALVLIGGGVTGLGIVLFAATNQWWIAVVAMIIAGIGQSVHGTALITSIQTLTAQEYMGRVVSILMMNQGLSGIGTFFVGFLTEGVGVQWAIGGFSAMLAVLSAAYFVLSPTVRKT